MPFWILSARRKQQFLNDGRMYIRFFLIFRDYKQLQNRTSGGMKNIYVRIYLFDDGTVKERLICFKRFGAESAEDECTP